MENPQAVNSESPLYLQIAEQVIEGIGSGKLRSGERLPGVRPISRAYGVSLATAVAAYRYLERENIIEARPRSGFFVKHRFSESLQQPEQSRPRQWPTPVTGQQRVMQVIEASHEPGLLHLGAAVPDPDLLPLKAIQRALASAARHPLATRGGYEFPPGFSGLREPLAARLQQLDCRVSAEEIVITNGGQEALMLALRTLCQPGDIVALESPAFYGLLQIIDALGLKALEIPTHPDSGISLDALQLAIEKWPIKVCVVVSNFSNPLGCVMPDSHKQQLAQMMEKAGIPLIEDDIYGDLSFDSSRPGTIKRHDVSGNILYCSSFSKTLSPGLRVGWLCPGRYLEAVKYQKFIHSCASPTVPQIAAGQLLASGDYDRHIHRMRGELYRSVMRMRERLCHHLPSGTRITLPKGGFVLWVELPPNVDSLALAQLALAEGVSIAAGPLFSASEKYRNFMRISCACPWSDQVELGLATLGRLARQLCQS